MTRVALDSNILAYLAGVSRGAADEGKIAAVRELVARLSPSVSFIAPTQTIGELFVVLLRGGATAAEARAVILEFADTFGTAASAIDTARAAVDLAVDHQFQYWDALILTAAAEAGCSMLLSEDMQDGFVTRGLTIINPLTDDVHPKLQALAGK